MSTNQTGKMMIAVVMVIIVASAAFSFVYFNENMGNTTTTPTTTVTPPTILPVNQPIVILNDTDFDAQAELRNWPGTGDPESPYKIENLSIVNDSVCIFINNVIRSFIIRNCSLNHTGEPYINRAALWLRNCTFGRVESCNIISQGQGVELFLAIECTVLDCTIEALGPGINVTLSEDIQLSLNRIFNCIWGIFICGWSNIYAYNNTITDCECGIISQSTSDCTVEANVIARNQVGLDIQMCSNWHVKYNTIIDNGDIGIKLDESSDSFLVGNKLGWNENGNALDNGLNNEWDDGEKFGNYWSDYEGTGEYSIPGSAGSVDHYPAVLERSEESRN